MMIRNRNRGFTLVELLIVIAVLSIVVALGYPSYRDQVRKARRAEGMGQLLELADRMERYYSDKGTYAGAVLGAIYPATTDGGYYTLTIDSQDAIAFQITAAPTSKGDQNSDKCGKFTLTSLGEKTVPDATIDEDQCWK